MMTCKERKNKTVLTEKLLYIQNMMMNNNTSNDNSNNIIKKKTAFQHKEMDLIRTKQAS